MIGIRVYLSFTDPDGERGPGVPFGAFAGTVQSRHPNPQGGIDIDVLLDEFLRLHRDGSEVVGCLVRVSDCTGLDETLASSGHANGLASLVPSPLTDRGSPLAFIGYVEVKISRG